MTTINPVTSTTENGAGSATVGKTFDPTEFMSVLVAELQNQDPMNGMQMSDFMNQFSSLMNMQQLSSLSGSIADLTKQQDMSEAFALLGKTVGASVAGQAVNGNVSGVSLDGGAPQLLIGNQAVPLSSVVSVTD